MTTDQQRKIFSTIKIQDLILKNRIFALPLFTGYALPDHRVSPLMIEHYRRLAKSGAAVVAVPNVAVADNGRTSERSLLLNHDKYIDGLKHLANTIKSNGALACLQLNHAGRYAITDHPFLPSAIDVSEAVHSISALKNFMESFPFSQRFGLTAHIAKMTAGWTHEMSDMEIEDTVKGFAEAAYRAYVAGFDLIELHGSTGYLISQFLSASTNRRGSPWGASFKRRMRFPLEILKAVKEQLPAGFPLGFRLLLDDKAENGITLDEATAFAKELERRGISYLSATAGSYQSMFVPETLKQLSQPGYLRKMSQVLCQQVKIPVIISGRIVTPKLAEKVLNNQEADIIGLGRPLLADSSWIRKAESGERVVGCRNCNTCFKSVVLGQPLVCTRWPQVFQDRTRLETRFYTRHGYRMLTILSSTSDLELARSHLLKRVPIHSDMVIRQLLVDTGQETGFEEAAQNYKLWSEHYLKTRMKRIDVESVYVGARQSPVNAILSQLADNFGFITFVHDRTSTWKEQLIQKAPSDRVLVRNGIHPNIKKVLVPCDLSPFTFMQIRLSLILYQGRTDVSCHFCHVTSNSEEAFPKWVKILSKFDLNNTTDLTLLELEEGETVAETLIRQAINGDYGCIIVGKQGGITRLRRKILGSVSEKLLRELPDRSFFIVG